ncbi:MAG: VCBS repeat-containing protein [Planctomycetales bacterium]|nr:VCBS repeat-containing protein [Planctomycetales bacterium]
MKEPNAAHTPIEIASFCGDCHALPKPNSFEQADWYDQVHMGYEFYARSQRTDLKPPPPQTVVQYYQAAAPERIQFPPVGEVDQQWRSKFDTTKLDWSEGDTYVMPAVASLKWLDPDGRGQSKLVVCDMRDGTVSLVEPQPGNSSRVVIARLEAPSRVVQGDLDGDGRQDLIVGDLGSFNPYDHGLGRVVWLRRTGDASTFEATNLIQGIGRVADLALGDYDADGQLDIAVAEFGHRSVGSLRVLFGRRVDGKQAFRFRVADIRPGTVRVISEDWDTDGRLDLASLVSQEYESVELFLNRETKFNRQPVWHAGDLTYGSVGMEAVDLDQDGDLDLLTVNGDCFDNNYANLTHGVQWLENQGNLRFEHHPLCNLLGAYRALPADMDMDGDLDIVAVANLPTRVKPVQLRGQQQVSMLLLEQTSKMNFEPHVLELGTPRYPALEIADFDGNGKLDLAVGAQLFGTDAPESQAAELPRLTIWWQN